MNLTGMFFMTTALTISAFYWYYNSSQETIKVLNENNAKLEVAVKTNEETVRVLQEGMKKASEELTRVNGDFAKTRAQNSVLSKKLARHDLANLAASKPGLVEPIVNNASTKAGRCFEILSGSELTEQEKGATSAKQFNSECPWLWTSTK